MMGCALFGSVSPKGSTLLQVDPDRAWDLIQSFVEHESKGSVLAALLDHFGPIVSARADDVADSSSPRSSESGGPPPTTTRFVPRASIWRSHFGLIMAELR